jgi:peptidoglycan/LPS O-acetylase OafA/YrhL
MAARERIPTLDGLRAVAITAVMISHGFILGDSPSRYARAITYTAEHVGALGVGLFFAISGYLITTLLLDERESTGQISLGALYTRRAFRILPAAYLYLAALVIFRKPLQTGELASATFFFSNYWPERSWFTQHFWSLSMEEHFYLLWPLTLTYLGPRKALKAAAFMILVIAIWRPWSLSHTHLSVPALQRTDMRLDAFLFASALAILSKSRRGSALLAVFCNSLFRFGAVFVLCVTSVWAVIGSAPAVSTIAQAMLLPALMISVIHWEPSWLYSVLESVPARWIGRISYGLYLWQQFFLVGHAAPTAVAAVQEFIPGIAITVCVATLSYHVMERPLLQFGRGISQRITAGRIKQYAADTPDISAQVSWRNESNAPNSEGSAGVRQRARGQAG